MADDDVDALYGLPLEEFVPARDGLARQLRRDKRKDDAAAVAALAKPTRPAWMVNQLARGEGALVAKLVECAEALAEAQSDALEGKGARDLRAASRAERQAVDRLVAAARDLRPEGRKPSAAMLERVRTTLQAVAGDDALREQIRTGRLVEEPAAGGAWPLIGLPGQSDDAAPPRPRTGRSSLGRSGDAKKSTDAPAGGRSPNGRAKTTEARSRASGTTVRNRRREDAAEPAEAVDEEAAARARERAAEEEEAEARRRREVRDALGTARKRAREADRDRQRARRDAERARERFERLFAEADSARAAAESAAATLDDMESTANEANDEVARLEAELKRD
jgi:hypothetical protein